MLRAPAAARPRVVMFNMAELSCRYHFDVRYSLIDMPVAFAALLVIPNLPDFYRQHPGIEIILSSSDRRRNMLHDGLDCILRVSDLSLYPDTFHQSPDSVHSALLPAVPQIQMDLAITIDASRFQPELFNLSCQSQVCLMAL